MKKFLKYLAITLISLYVAFLVVPRLINLNSCISLINEEAKKATGLDVKVGEMKLYTTPAFKAGIKIKDISVYYPNGNTMAKSGDADVRLKLLPLLLLKVELDKIDLQTPEFNLILNKDGSTDLENFLTEQFSTNLPKGATSETSAEKSLQNQEATANNFPIKISNNLPKINVTNYKFNIADVKNETNLTLNGNQFLASGNIVKNIKVSTDGSFNANDKKIISYDVSVDTFVPEFTATTSQPQEEAAAPIKVDLTPLSKIVEKQFKTDIIANLKIRESRKNINIDGFFNATGIEYALNNVLLKENFIKAKFDKNNTIVNSDFNFPENEKISLNANVNSGKKTTSTISLTTNKLSLNNVFDTLVTLLEIANIDIGAQNFSVNGVLTSNIDLTLINGTISSNGELNLAGGTITHKFIPLDISGANFNIGVQNNNLLVKAATNVNGSNVILDGKITADAVVDFLVKTDVLPLSQLYTAFAPNDLKKIYDLKNGTLVMSLDVKGNFKNISPCVKASVTNFDLYDKTNKISVKFDSANADIKSDLKSFDGTIALVNANAIITNEAKIKIPSLKGTIDSKDFKLAKSSVLINSSPIELSGGVYNYMSKPDIDLAANGKLLSKDLLAFIPKDFRTYFAASGTIPVKASINGNDKNLSLIAQVFADSANYFTPINVKDITNKQSLLNAQFSTDYKNLKIDDISLSYYPLKAQFNDNLQSNLKNKSALATINGAITDVTGKAPSFKNFNLTLPQKLSFELAGFKKSLIKGTGALNISGTLTNPQINGDLKLDQIDIPDLLISTNDITLGFKQNSLNANCKELNINNSVLSGSAQIQSILEPVIVINTLDVNSRIVDLDQFFVFIEKIMTMFPAPQTTQTTVSNRNTLVVPVKIIKGTGVIKEFKMTPIKASNATGNFTLIDDKFVLNNLKATVYEGIVDGTVKYDLKTLFADVDIKGDKINVKPFITDFIGIKDQVLGTAKFGAKITLTGAEYTEQMKSMKGNVTFDVIDGQLGNLGRFETFINAPNLKAISGFTNSLSTMLASVTPQNTGQFDYLKGNITLKDGFAILDKVEMSGQSMSLYLTGKYNILTADAKINAYGNISNKVVELLGPLTNISVSRIAKNFGSFGKTAANLLNNYNQTTNNEDLKKIPVLKGNEVGKSFGVVIDGNVMTPQTAVKSFKWLATSEEINTAKSELNLNLSEQAKNLLENPKETLKETGKNFLQNVLSSEPSSKTQPVSSTQTTSTTTQPQTAKQAVENFKQKNTTEKVKSIFNVLDTVNQNSTNNQ